MRESLRELAKAMQSDAGEAANMAKFAAGEAATRAIDAAIQTHGGNGMSEEYGLVALWGLARTRDDPELHLAACVGAAKIVLTRRQLSGVTPPNVSPPQVSRGQSSAWAHFCRPAWIAASSSSPLDDEQLSSGDVVHTPTRMPIDSKSVFALALLLTSAPFKGSS